MQKTKPLYLSAFVALSLLACNPENREQADATTQPGATAAVATSNPAAETTPAAETDAPLMTFTETVHDFGNIKEGDVVKHTFKFTNTGKSPLIIQNASAPCGCTTPSWTKEPVAPGGNGEVTVQFNSQGKVGQQNKVVTIVANTQPDITTVTMKGNVDPGVSAMNGPVAR
ncbi:MAG: DUF1573 domain-containing protein [Ferruginibacter sp.]|nr:DUF1573 domain-containing protein [Cytophagales bacterium]